MCYVRYSARDNCVKRDELTASSWVDIARQASEHGMVFLLLTGGEIFLRRDIFEIYEPLTKMGFIINLFSNGTLITNRIAERLASAPPNRMEITLYGATAKTYKDVTGAYSGYERCCSGVEQLLKYKVPLGLKTTVTKDNFHEIESMRQMANNWGLSFSVFTLLSKRPDGGVNKVEQCRLGAVECVNLEIRSNPTKWSDAEQTFSNLRQNNFNCLAGKASFSVNPSGEINACLDLPHPRARIQEEGFFNAWKKVQMFVDNASAVSSTCANCDSSYYCRRCPAWSLMETGSLNQPVPYLCEIADERRKQYGKNK
jgi:radical SAM protein with 4Fe4S-binding SPASM domain